MYRPVICNINTKFKLLLIRAIKAAISMLVFCFDVLLTLFTGKRHGQCIILYYHSLPEKHAEAFGRQLDRFLKILKPISNIDDLPSQAEGRFGMITFDDGYESVVNYALPLLRSRKIHCTIFIPTGSLKKRPQWVSDPNHMFFNERVIDQLQIAKLAENDLVTIGSHGINHVKSVSIDDKDFIHEITGSKKTLEKITNYPVTLFSFPHGEYNQRHLELLRSAGYMRVFSVDPKTEQAGSIGYLIGRVLVSPDDWQIEFLLKLHGAYRWQSWKYPWRKRDE